MGKLSFLTGAAVGYVLGARAGKQRYEQIKIRANRVWSSQPVQARVGEATEAVKKQAAPFVADKLGDAAKAASKAMRHQGGQKPSTGSSHRAGDGRQPGATTGFASGADRMPYVSPTDPSGSNE